MSFVAVRPGFQLPVGVSPGLQLQSDPQPERGITKRQTNATYIVSLRFNALIPVSVDAMPIDLIAEFLRHRVTLGFVT
jgi:hypothetical protein